MKRLGWILLLGVLVACGDDTDAQEPKEEPKAEVTQQEESEEETTEDVAEPVEDVFEEEANVTPTQAIYHAWGEDDDSNMGWMSVYGIITNEGDTPAQVDEVTINYYDESGNVITTTTTGINVTPSVIAPGEKAYISNVEQLTKEQYDTFGEGTIESVTASPVKYTMEEVEVTGDNFDGTSVTGKADGATEVAAGLYNQAGDIIGVLDSGEVNASAFDLFSPEIPFYVPDETVEVKVKAYK